MIAISIVSHGHGNMVSRLVEKLLNFPQVTRVIVTFNIPEHIQLPNATHIRTITNETPQGFAANHNSAFNECREEFFCALNPDVEFMNNPFPLMLNAFLDKRVALVAPRVVSTSGAHEDSWRQFPSLRIIFGKVLGGDGARYGLRSTGENFEVDWVAGMFMLFRSKVFHKIGRFDDRYFLYYEDVDVCVRIWRSGFRILACPTVCVAHAARRESHRRMRYFLWHLCSMLRYFRTHWFRLPKSHKHSGNEI